MAGIWPKSCTKCFKSAAPVGVQSSASISPAQTGMPSSSAAVAGAGTGSTPCAQRTVPKPVHTGDAVMRSGASSCSSRQQVTMSVTASSVPSS